MFFDIREDIYFSPNLWSTIFPGAVYEEEADLTVGVIFDISFADSIIFDVELKEE
jgi:hypothetical protein